MKENLQDIKNKISAVIDGLENTLFVAARDIRLLKQVGSGDYADAILDQNGFGGNTAEIYFYRFAPRGSPCPSNKTEFLKLLSDLKKSKAYEKACYQKWTKGIKAVQRVVKQYSGLIEINNMPLDEYLTAVNNYNQTPNHRVHVRISVPGQDKLCKLREIASK